MAIATAARPRAFALEVVIALGLAALLASPAAAVRVDTTWIGGDGLLSDATNWSGSLPAAPINSAGSSYFLSIDSDPSTSSTVVSDVNGAVAAIFVDVGDELQVANGTRLNIDNTGDLGSGVLTNDGTVTVGTGTGAAGLASSAGLNILGTGELVLGGGGASALISGGTLVQEAGHTIRGAGTITASRFTNQGIVIADSATPLVIVSSFDNYGTTVVATGSELQASSVVNYGSLDVQAGGQFSSNYLTNRGALVIGAGAAAEIAGSLALYYSTTTIEAGGTLDVARLSSISNSDITIEAGGKLASTATSLNLGYGSVHLRGGTIESAGPTSTGHVDGSGSFAFTRPGLYAAVGRGSSLSPGSSSAAGSFDIAGDIGVNSGGFLAFDIFGSSPGEFDQITLTGSALIQPYYSSSEGPIRAAFGAGASIQRGDSYSLLEAQEGIVLNGPIGTVVSLPDAGGNLFVTAAVESMAGTGSNPESLVMRVKERLTATWIGADGLYSDAGNWSFSGALDPSSAGSPTEDSTTLFDVIVANSSRITLGDTVVMDRLQIGAGSEVALTAGAELTLTGDGRPDALAILNEGRIDVDGGAILGTGDMVFSGNGEIVLSDNAANRIGDARDADITNGVGHTIRGAGVIDPGASAAMRNEGTIRSEGAQELVVGGRVENTATGALEVTSGSTLRFRERWTLANRGAIDVAAGGTLEAETLTNYGTMRIAGPGATATINSFGQAGALDVSDGALLTTRSFGTHSTALTTRVSNGAVLEATSGGSVQYADFVLDGGTLRSGRDFSVSYGGALRGSGDVDLRSIAVFSDTELRVQSGGALAPGLAPGDIGLIAIDGNLLLTQDSQFDIDIQSTLAGGWDQVAVSGDATFYPGAQLAANVGAGFGLTRGDKFEVLTAGTIITGPLYQLLRPDSATANNLYLLPTLQSSAAGDVLSVVAKAPVVATWSGGAGAYTDSSWSYDLPVLAGQSAFPSADDTALYHVEIDGGGAADSRVTLGQRIEIESLSVSAGDTLAAVGANLEIHGGGDLAGNGVRAGSGVIANDGTIELGNATTASTIEGAGNLVFSGSGTLQMSDLAGNTIGAYSGDAIHITNEAGHTIRGAGEIRSSATSRYSRPLITNNGSIVADGSNALKVIGELTNNGSLVADGGTLEVSRYFMNTGHVEARNGGQVRNTSNYNWSNQGTIRLDGPGVGLDIAGLWNYGTFELTGGADARLRYSLGNQPGGRTYIGAGSTLFADVTVDGGVVEIDGGRIDGRSIYVRGGQLNANGSAKLTSALTIASGGAVEIGGADSAGAFDVFGQLNLQGNGRLISEHGATAADILRVYGAASLQAGSQVELRTLGGRTIGRGDMFEIFDAESIQDLGVGPDFVVGPSVSGLFLIHSLEASALGEALRVRALAPVAATWNGGTGNYFDAAQWGFDAPLPGGSAGVPSQDFASLFHVRIGDDGSLSNVTLDRDARIESLLVGAQSELLISGATASPRLAISGNSSRPGSLRVDNDGRIVLAGGASLFSGGNLSIAGSGEIVLQSAAGGPASTLGVSEPDAFGLTNDAGHTIRGAGLIDVTTRYGYGALNNVGSIVADDSAASLVIDAAVANSGVLEATAAGDLQLNSSLDNRPTGIVRATGGGSVRFPGYGQFSNEGSVEAGDVGSLIEVQGSARNFHSIVARDGARVDFKRGIVNYGGDLEAVNGGSLGLYRSTIYAGRLILDSGSADFDAQLHIGSGARLEGTGSLTGATPAANLYVDGAVAPGIGGVGSLDITGRMRFSSHANLEVDLAGSNAGEFDQIVLTGSLEWDEGATLDPNLLGSFVPQMGDSFSVVQTNGTVIIGGPLGTIVSSPDLGGGLFLVADVLDTSVGQDLALRVKQSVVATWNGGVGDYLSGGGWSFDTPLPSSATGTPNEDAFALYHVVIDGETAAASDVSLNGDAVIESLTVSAGDSLALESTADLRFAGSSRPNTGVVNNDGTIDLRSGARGAELSVDSDLAFVGSGEVRLAADGTSKIESTYGVAIQVDNGAGHTIRGGGLVDLGDGDGTLSNSGTILVEGATPLVIRGGGLDNLGTLNVAGGASLEIEEDGTNAGTLEVSGGGRIYSDPLYRTDLSNSGTLRVAGAGSSAEFYRIYNQGTVELLDGAYARASLSQNSSSPLHPGGPLLHIGNGAVFDAVGSGASYISAGTLRLDGGTYQNDRDLSLLRVRFEGDGLVDLAGNDLSVAQGALAPGLGGIGRIDVVGDAYLNSTSYELDLGVGSTSDMFATSGNLRLGSSVQVAIAPVALGGVQHGDAFRIFDAAKIETLGFTASDLIDDVNSAAGLFLVGSVESSSAGESYMVRAKKRATATWTGGAGNYSNTPSWVFDQALLAGAGGLPSNDSLYHYDVRVGDLGAASDVLLDQDAEIESLYVGANSTVNVGDGRMLRFTGSANRAGSLTLENDGIVRVGSAGALTQIAMDDDLLLTGAGVLELSDNASNRIGGLGERLDITNDAGHTLRGAGVIDMSNGVSTSYGFIRNRGRIEANGTNALELSAVLENSGVAVASGSGGMVVRASISNQSNGLIRVGAGSQLTSDSFVSNSGAVQLDSGASLFARSFAGSGDLSLASDATLQTTSSIALYSGSFTDLGPRASLESAASVYLDGHLSMNDSDIDALMLRLAGGELSGSGRVNGSVTVERAAATIRPGTASNPFGQLEIFGDADLRIGSLVLDHDGTNTDRVVISGDATFGAGTIDLNFRNGFSLGRGDELNLLDAGSIVSLGPLVDVLSGGTLDPGLFMTVQIGSTLTGSQQLVVGAKQLVAASWTGGAGNWSDASWAFDSPLPAGSAASPSEDRFSLFDVAVDGGLTSSALVTLDQDARVDRLSVSVGDEVVIADGNTLTVAQGNARAHSGALHNDGRVSIEASTLATGLNVAGQLDITGSGELVMGGDLASIRSGGGATSFLLNHGAGHTIRGSGTIDTGYATLSPYSTPLDTFLNAGTVIADQSTPLSIRGTTLNTGRLEADGGTLVMGGRVVNDSTGTISVHNGGSFESTNVGVGGVPSVFNLGLVDVAGVGSSASFATLRNRGNIAVTDGAFVQVSDFEQSRLYVPSLPPATTLTPTTTIASGAELEVGRYANVGGGVVELDNATLTAAGLAVSGNSRLRGSGTVRQSGSQTTSIYGGAVLEVGNGVGDLGHLDFDGRLRLTGSTLEMEVAGFLSGQADVLRVTNGALEFVSGSLLQLDKLGGFSATRGDRLDLIEASSIFVEGPLADLVQTSGGGSLFLIPELETSGATHRLVVAAKAAATATWSGGSGDYSDAASWSMDAPLPAGSTDFPTNDAFTIFHVNIDGDATQASAVDLTSDVFIESLGVGTGDALDIRKASTLTITGSASRAGSRQIDNDGTIRMAEGARISADSDLQLAGGGELVLVENSKAELTTAFAGATVSNEAGHTIRGGGSIFANTHDFTNVGSIIADNGDLMSLGRFINTGLLQTTGTGGINVDQVTNSGTIDISNSTLAGTGVGVTNTGLVRVDGAAGSLSVSSFGNGGRFELTNGAVADIYSFTTGGTVDAPALTRIDATSSLLVGRDAYIRAGTLRTEGGSVVVARTLRVDSGGRLEGVGDISANTLWVTSGGTVAPGLGGTGDLRTANVFLGGNGRLETSLGSAKLIADDIAFYDGAWITIAPDVAAPSQGDIFHIAEAANLQLLNAPVGNLVENGYVAPGLLLVADVLPGAGAGGVDSLILRTKAALRATFSGSGGSYSDLSKWNFFGPQNTGSNTFGANTDDAVYEVELLQDGVASLDADIHIQNLLLDDRAELHVEGGRSLSLAGTNDPDSGRIRNYGAVRLGTGGVGASLRVDRDLALEGTGELVMSDSAQNTIAGSMGQRIDVHQAAGHTLRGAGRIELGYGTFYNSGLVEAEGVNALEIVNFVENNGTLSSTSGGRLIAHQAYNDGEIRVAGSNSSMSIGEIGNNGRIHVSDGALLETDYLYGTGYTMAEGRSLTIESGATVDSMYAADLNNMEVSIDHAKLSTLGYVGVTNSDLRLNEGDFESEYIVTYGASRISGTGRIHSDRTGASTALYVEYGGELAPGLDGAGTLAVDGDVFLEGTLSLELAPDTSVEEQQLLAVLGTLFIGNGSIVLDLLTPREGEPDGEFDERLANWMGGEIGESEEGESSYELGDYFDLVVATKILGFGDATPLDLPELGNDLGWSVGVVALSGSDALRFSIVPEPGTGTLLSIGLLFLAARRERRR